MSIVIKNGRVIDPSTNTDRVADVLIVDGRIAGSGGGRVHVRLLHAQHQAGER